MPHETFHIVDGHRLESIRIAPMHPSMPTVVFLHEGLGSVRHWRDFPGRVAARTGAGVFVYSRHGHGNSTALDAPRTPAYMHHEAEVVLPAILEQAGIHRPVVLGHSDGASIAIIYAGRFPAGPSALILEAPHVIVEGVTVENIALARTAYETTDLPTRLGRYHSDVNSMFWGWNNIWLDPAFRTWNIEHYVNTIACPTLVIQGADDEYGTVEQVRRMQARMPSLEFNLVPNCRHAPHRDQPELTLERIIRFLRAHRRLRSRPA